MAYTQTQLDALKNAYALGLLEVSFQGRREVFASGDDLRRRIMDLEAELDLIAGTNTVRTIRIFQDDTK